MIKAIVVLTSVLGLVSAECPNGCSSHGKCTAYDMCLCYRNWMSNDCSERVCQFGLAHVDTPKGDLDASSGALSGPSKTVAINSEVYPYGTTEQFPSMLSDGEVQTDTAHYYMECSNKGICDRSSGSCECFPGYEGSACQRASCPTTNGAVCSGHGTCETIKQIAARDYSNIYELWDEKATLGCVCDAGYSGADCAQRECKYGADPLYYDDNSNIRYSNWTYAFAAASINSPVLSGTYSIKFFDHFGEDWETRPLAAYATCDEIVSALEDIPNDVIPDGSVRCRQYLSSEPDFNVGFWDTATATFFVKYTIMFPQNPGYLREIQINKYLDGARPTLNTNEVSSTLQIFVFANGFHGEDEDVVPDECEGVLVTFARTFANSDFNTYFTLQFSDPTVQEPLLKRCLGDADNKVGYDSGNQADEVFNWDYGTEKNPHLVKFVEATSKPQSRICHKSTDQAFVDADHGYMWCFETAPAGFYAPVIYVGSVSAGAFTVFSRAPYDYENVGTEFRVFTTKGYLNRVSESGEVYTPTSSWADYHSNVLYTKNIVPATAATIYGGVAGDYFSQSEWYGNIDCETNGETSDTFADDCLQKGDYVFFFSTERTQVNYNTNPKYHNMYKVEKIYRSVEDATNRIVLDKHVNFQFPVSTGASPLYTDSRLKAYKFYPSSAVTYVEQCSGRGLCNNDEGLCECFPGYTNDDCSVQNSAAA